MPARAAPQRDTKTKGALQIYQTRDTDPEAKFHSLTSHQPFNSVEKKEAVAPPPHQLTC
jgi:hypothetical protein